MVTLSPLENSVVRKYLSHENPTSAKKRLHRHFVQMIANCGGCIDDMKEGNANISFKDEEKDFIQLILEQLAKEEGLPHKIWQEREGVFGIDEIHQFIQDDIDYLERQGYDEATIRGVVQELDILFQLSVRVKLQRCHELLDCYALNLRPYLYTYQHHFMDEMMQELTRRMATATVEAAIYCSDLGSFIKDAMELSGADKVEELYGPDDDAVKDEYMQRDQAAIQFLRENPEFKALVEKRAGATIEEIWRLEGGDHNGENVPDEKPEK